MRRAQIRRQAYNLNQQGNRLIRQGRHTDAVRAYSQALRLTPYDRVIRQNLDNARSWVRYAEEKAAEARRARQEALAEANKRRARVAGMVGDLARDLKTEAGPTLVTMSDFIPAANAPFGIPGSPKVALATKPEDKPRLVPTASAQLEAAKMIAKQLNGGSLEEIMREQAQCGFDRGPCAGGVPFAALSLEGRLAQQRGMEALEPAVARAVLQTEKGRQLAAQENEIRAQLAESREKAKAISRQIETSSPSDKPKREAEVVKERGRADRLNQQLHGVQAEIVSFSISLEEAPAQQRGTTPRPAGTDAGGKTAPQGGAAPPEGKAGN